jgi:hypothetical protein
MRFQFEKLRPVGGEAYGHVFENVRTGAPRAIYWSFTVNFAPLRYGTASFETAATCEWITWPIRSWHRLAGNNLSTSDRLVEPEASFYLEEHNMADHAELEVCGVKGTMLNVRLSLRANIEGLDGETYPDAEITTSTQIPFVGIYVLPDNLFPKPSSQAEATACLAQFIDADEFLPPEWEGFRFTFRPRAA